MTEKTGGSTAADEGAGELRGKLVTRLAMAGLLVAVLLGILAMFDYLASAPDEADSPVFEQPVPVAPRKEVSRPVTPADNLPEPPVAAEPVAAEPAPAGPTVAASPASAAAENGVPQPSTATRRAPLAATGPEVPPVPEATRSAPMVQERVPATPVENAPQRPAVRIEPRPAAALPPLAPRLFSGFVLQAGVFSSVQRAEELHARLTLSGVPSTLETRVQVGPFRTRQEAEAAQAKLRELGIQAILVPPRGARR